MLFDDAEQRRQDRQCADLVEAVAMGYSGCKSKEGSRALERFIAARRK